MSITAQPSHSPSHPYSATFSPLQQFPCLPSHLHLSHLSILSLTLTPSLPRFLPSSLPTLPSFSPQSVSRRSAFTLSFNLTRSLPPLSIIYLPFLLKSESLSPLNLNTHSHTFTRSLPPLSISFPSFLLTSACLSPPNPFTLPHTLTPPPPSTSLPSFSPPPVSHPSTFTHTLTP